MDGCPTPRIVHVDCTFTTIKSTSYIDMISSRKSITLALSSSSFVSLNSKPRSRLESKTHVVDFSVDEIFVQYSIPQIQRLQQEYKANFVKSKDDLHHLVGRKYRDLIRIAEDIEELSTLSRQIDSQLTDLSYKSPNYVEFGKNRFSSFNSLVRKKKASTSRITSHKTILNNVINNKLIGYDLRLQTDSIKRASTLVDVAKLYYTIGTSFKRTLKENPHVSGNLYQLKNNFIRYLESKISSYSTPSMDFVQGGLNKDEFFVANVKFALAEGESFDLITGNFDDEAQEVSDEEDFEASETAYRGSPYPIVNYLIAYIIVNHDDPKLDNLEKITAKFIDLRYDYLESFVSLALESGVLKDRAINFTMIFQFIEATCGYLQKFFLSNDGVSNDLQTQLQYIVTWNTSDLIGFHNWFEEESVAFNKFSYQMLSSEVIEGIQSRLSKFGIFVYQLGSKLVSETNHGTVSQNATNVLNLFYMFAYELRKCEVVFLSNSSVCYLTKLLSEENVVSKLLHDVVLSFESNFAAHLDSLTKSENSIMSHIVTEFGTQSALSSAAELFTPDFVNMIDVDVDLYFESVLEISSASNPVSELETARNSLQELKHWFYVLEELLEATKMSADNNLATISRILKKEFREVEGVTKTWGQFSSDTFQSSFSALHKKQIDSSRSEIESLIGKISSTLDGSTPGAGSLQFLLNLLIILKDNVVAVGKHPEVATLDDQISKQVLTIYQQIFSEILSIEPEGSQDSFRSLLQDSLALVSNLDSSTVPVRPHLAVHSTVFELAYNLLKSPRFRQHEMCNMYTDSGVKEYFVLVKNEWIKSDLIATLLITSSEKPSTIEQENTSVESLESVADADVETGFESQVSVQGEGTEIEVSAHEETTDNGNMDDGWTQEEDGWAHGEDGWAQEDEWPDEKSNGHTEEQPQEEIESEPADTEKTSDTTTEATSADNETVDECISESVEKTTEKVPSTSQASNEHARQALANAVFLLNLTSDENIDTSDECLKNFVSSLENNFGVELEHSTVAIIVRGVNEFYKANKEMYLPLLVN